MVTREDIIAAFPIAAALEKDGVKLLGAGTRKMALCPFHQDKVPSFSVNVETGLWFCFSGCGGGSIIDYVARKTGRPTGEVFKELAAQCEGRPKKIANLPQAGEVVATYVYRNALSKEVFRVLRYDPKSFRQQRFAGGAWVWGMEGVERVPYRLPEILSAPEEQAIWLTAGEKDVETLVAAGFNATTNVGGEASWSEGYVTWFAGKDVVLCGDNDDAGQKFIAKVSESLDGKVKRLRIITIPKPDKDVSDYRVRFGARDAFQQAMLELLVRAVVIVQGASVPILSMIELEDRYIELQKVIETRSYSFSNWLPGLGAKVRPLLPGDVCTFAAATGNCKSGLLFNMAFTSGLPTVLFELELAESLTFCRFVAGVTGFTQSDIAEQYRAGYRPPWRDTGKLDQIYTCSISNLTVSGIETIVTRSELKIGAAPVLVMIDYAQLVSATGKSRYERMTENLLDIKRMAKSTGTIVVLTSQIARKPEGSKPDVNIFDSKESGQLENSSSLLIGAWRDVDDDKLLHLKVNKNTTGRTGYEILCNFDAQRQIITERSPISA